MLRKFIIIFLAFPALAAAQKADTLKPRITRQYTLSSDWSEEVLLPFDTTFSLFHQFRRTEKFSEFNAWPGNYGLPVYQLNFFDRITDPEKHLYRYYYPYMHLADNAVFLDTQVPFTEMVFFYAGPRNVSDQEFRIRHSQNVNRKLNFGLVYDIIYSLGQYSYQRANDKTFALHSSYTGEKYKLYAQFGLNNIENLENGGIADPAQMETFETRDMEVKLGSLNNAKSVLKNWNFLLVQKLSVNKVRTAEDDSLAAAGAKRPFRVNGTFSHIITIDNNRRSYSDSYPGAGFYDSIYISPALTFDSLTMRVIKNTVRFDFSTDESRKFRLGGGVGIRNELIRYSQIIPTPAITPPDSVIDIWHEDNNAVIGRLFNNIGNKFRWTANGELWLTGRRSGDFNLEGLITKDFGFKRGAARWEIMGSMSSLTPSMWYQRYGSNHFKWDLFLLKELRINAGTRFSYPAINTSLRFNYTIIDNYTSFGADALPYQHTGGLSVVSAAARNNLRLWKFHLANDVLVQQSTNRNVLDLPALAVRSAAYFEHNIHFKITNGNLLVQLGAEAVYNTSYHSYSYMPSTGTYYNTAVEKTGNYPFLNAFLNVKIKRTRILLMLDHFNSGMTGYEYFLVPGNPMNIRCFRYGLAWTFYD